MSYEVDWRAVGEESKSGDCIALHFGDFLNNSHNQTVVVIDGGFQDTGENVVKLIKEVYKSDSVDLVISTHPDNDHMSGLSVVLEELKVGELWMHKPWERQEDIFAFVTEGIITKRDFKEAVRKSLAGAHDLAKLAKKKGIPIHEPFQGKQAFDGVITVLGPTEDFYNETLAKIESGSGTQTVTGAIKQAITGLAEKALTWIDESWGIELLMEPSEDAVSSRNNGSVISLAKLEDTAFMFTADAGVPAISPAADYAESLGYIIASDVTHVQVPHHGRKHNVGPSILDRMYGPRVSEEEEKRKKVAMISAAKQGAPKHPNGRIINALNRRGVTVLETASGHKVTKSTDVPCRDNWGPAMPVPFQSRFQDSE